MNKPFVEPLIRLYFCGENPTLTTEEFEALTKELAARRIADDLQLGDKILGRLLYLNYGRYVECLETKKAHKEIQEGKKTDE
jgi:hypothetical protein